MDAMQYLGMLRVVRREKGIRIYKVGKHWGGGAQPPSKSSVLTAGQSPRLTSGGEAEVKVDALVDTVVRIYAPLPGPSLAFYLRRLRFAAPQWRGELTSALQRAKQRLAHARAGANQIVDWYWPAAENALGHKREERVRLLAPFDPLVHDRARFELLWGWVYRFEAYTPVTKRKLGYYAMPLLWRDRVIGWGNLAVKDGELKSEFGYVAGRPPREAAFRREFDAELDRMRVFLGISAAD
jgi:uncharacterized protein YcaQ